MAQSDWSRTPWCHLINAVKNVLPAYATAVFMQLVRRSCSPLTRVIKGRVHKFFHRPSSEIACRTHRAVTVLLQNQTKKTRSPLKVRRKYEKKTERDNNLSYMEATTLTG